MKPQKISNHTNRFHASDSNDPQYYRRTLGGFSFTQNTKNSTKAKGVSKLHHVTGTKKNCIPLVNCKLQRVSDCIRQSALLFTDKGRRQWVRYEGIYVENQIRMVYDTVYEVSYLCVPHKRAWRGVSNFIAQDCLTPTT